MLQTQDQHASGFDQNLVENGIVLEFSNNPPDRNPFFGHGSGACCSRVITHTGESLELWLLACKTQHSY
jgi:hypothetical protein